MPQAAWPGVQLARIDLQLLHTALPPGGVEHSLSIPPGFDDVALTAQLLTLSTTANNGLYATSRALEVALEAVEFRANRNALKIQAGRVAFNGGSIEGSEGAIRLPGLASVTARSAQQPTCAGWLQR